MTRPYFSVVHVYFESDSPDDARETAEWLVQNGVAESTASYMIVRTQPLVARRLYSSKTEIRIPAGSAKPALHVLEFPMTSDGQIACKRCLRFISAAEWAKPCPGPEAA